MSAATPVSNHFLLYVQDLPNSQRAKYAEQHLAQNAPLFQSGTVREYNIMLAMPKLCKFEVRGIEVLRRLS